MEIYRFGTVVRTKPVSSDAKCAGVYNVLGCRLQILFVIGTS